MFIKKRRIGQVDKLISELLWNCYNLLVEAKGYFITGSSGVGKSTLIQVLKKKLPRDYAVHDFDELGVPLDADHTWRIETEQKWVSTMEENATHQVSTIVAGLIYPEEILNLHPSVVIHFLYLDVSDQELKRRLYAHRFSTPERIANLMRYEQLTPEAFFLKNGETTANLRAQCKKVSAHSIDTSTLPPEKVAASVISWIETN